MFEKSLYDLIRGRRNHKGNEAEYIQHCLGECRKEIRSSDMDMKATALLKLVYLEMFGHDMSWAAFHVLEVMSSAKYPQKRVGYLGAVQSFRSETEVLMLATNLLKKDLTSSVITTMSLPLLTLPHILSPSLALSLLPDVILRMSHSSATVRKKAVVVLYRLALVYPEALRVAWPKMKDLLLDPDENSSVTAAIINVVCELGWRRPHDFLPLAPRFFDLLIEGGNNWMSIKIIKLFAVLTPLEPRLVKKLVRPLTNLIQSTSAMSLLYECINGIIQGGILEATDGIKEGDDVAYLCIDKLRSMIVVDGDPNLKYVALLAFNRIATSHPNLVMMQQDVIMDCLTDLDSSIRLQALEVSCKIVTSDNLQVIVERLIQQLKVADSATTAMPEIGKSESAIAGGNCQTLSSQYRFEVLDRILDICCRDTYASVSDFEWYIDILTQMSMLTPMSETRVSNSHAMKGNRQNVAERIGTELLNIAVRVKAVRFEATRAAESLIMHDYRQHSLHRQQFGGRDVLAAGAWVAGEYPAELASARDLLEALIASPNSDFPAHILTSYIQAIPKVFAHLIARASSDWGPSTRSSITLLLARIIHFFEKLATHPDLEVQERCVEFLELFRLTSEAVSSEQQGNDSVPLLLSSVIPSLFSASELNPVAAGAQKKVPCLELLDFDAVINPHLVEILHTCETDWLDNELPDDTHYFYHVRELNRSAKEFSDSMITDSDSFTRLYTVTGALEDDTSAEQRKVERRIRYKDDPFYIGDEAIPGSRGHAVTAINAYDLDLDAIPIIDLELDSGTKQTLSIPDAGSQAKLPKKRKQRKFEIAAEESVNTLGISDGAVPLAFAEEASSLVGLRNGKIKKSLLEVDSSGLRKLTLGEDGAEEHSTKLELEAREAEEAEMAKALQEVERLRLEMQRASERIQASNGAPADGTLITRKKKKKRIKTRDEGHIGETAEDGTGQETQSPIAQTKRRQKRRINVMQGP